MNKYTTISVAALAALLVGCTEWGNPPFRNAIPTTSGPWKADVERLSDEDDIKFASGSGKINNAGIAKLKGLVGRKTTPKPPVHARIITHTARGDMHNLTKQRIATIIRCLKKLGDICPNMIEVFYAEQTDTERKNTITVSLDQYRAVGPQCPGWNEYMNTYGMPEGEAHFGCTYAKNEGAMLHDPYDMYKERRSPAIGQADGERQNLAISRYRKGKEEPLKIEKVETGK
ncbi:MAG: CpaD family pilus assembly lipoprotein [Pseudomonadota bacterium]